MADTTTTIDGIRRRIATARADRAKARGQGLVAVALRLDDTIKSLCNRLDILANAKVLDKCNANANRVDCC